MIIEYFAILLIILCSIECSHAFNVKNHGNLPFRFKQMESSSRCQLVSPFIGNENVQRSDAFPIKPSQDFLTLAESQFELLSNSLVHSVTNSRELNNYPLSKVESMALYLPQENKSSGELEFLPVVLYPSPRSERVFIATDAATGLPPTIPQRSLAKLPGFVHAQTLIPAYPFCTSSPQTSSKYRGEGDSAVGVGQIEEVMCDPSQNTGCVLSVPLFHGARTVGGKSRFLFSPLRFQEP